MADGISNMPPSLVKDRHDAISLSDEKDRGKSDVDVNVLEASDASVDLEQGDHVHD